MTGHLKLRVVQTPLALASDGSLLVNALQLGADDDLDAVVRLARESGLPVFVGVVVPARLRGRLAGEIDDGLADVVGRVGPLLTPSVWGESASVPSSADPVPGRPGRRDDRAPRPRGRKP